MATKTNCMYPKNWWYQLQGVQKGPVTQQELLTLLEQQFITGETLVFQPGMPSWMMLGNVKQAMLYGPPLGSGVVPEATNIGSRRDWLTVLLLCIFLGPLGIHRFYTGHTAI